MRYLATAKATKAGLTGVGGKQSLLIDELLESDEQLNQTVNELRDVVRKWRESGYPGTSMTTRKLLQWWFERADERAATGKRFFFCQQEAVEVVLYLYEVSGRHKMPDTGDLLRYALKLATGTGKTIVMALLITWSAIHSRKVAGSTLSSNFVVLVPNLTVRDRVWGTDPFTRQPTAVGLNPNSSENLYAEMEMVPPDFSDVFRPQVVVRNWQSIPLEGDREDWLPDDLQDDGKFLPASVLWALRRKRSSDPRNAIRRALGNFSDAMILNDEAHHAYGEKRTPKGTESGYIRWNKILDLINQSIRVALVVDVSATPWYGSGSIKPDGTLFEWLISDFSVYDAFESGLVKVVRLPDPTEEGYRYLNLWDSISAARTKEEYLAGCKGAIANMYSSWLKDFNEWGSYFESMRLGPPPVMLAVADRAERAKWLFEHLTSEYESLRNPASEDPRDWYTIQVDSKVFDAEKGREAVLREMVNSVGKPAKAGERVRCIVSVNMLSEGWDVKNVTHILGLRAFGSPLLTEQVIGRGLRRVDYTALNVPIAERVKNQDRTDEETLDAFGIPFVGFPVERRKRARMKGFVGQSELIGPEIARAAFEVDVPNVRAWAVGVSRPLVDSVDVDSLPSIVVAGETPATVRVRPVVGSQPEELLDLELFRREYPLLRTTFLIAQELWGSVAAHTDGVLTGPTFEEVLELVRQYMATKVSAKKPNSKLDVGIYMWRRRVLDILETAVRDAPHDTVTVPIFGEPPRLSSGAVAQFRWPALTAIAKRTHWNLVPCHTPLEAQFAQFLDDAPDVDRFLKNERLGFSVTYYDNGRVRQYFPDFIVAVNRQDSVEWWLAETKGEIRPNTQVKKEAAELWCDRMTRSGQEAWRHLFVQQNDFKKVWKPKMSFAKLVDQLRPSESKLFDKLARRTPAG